MDARENELNRFNERAYYPYEDDYDSYGGESSDYIKREIDDTRARLGHTVEQLQDRFSIRTLADEFFGMLSGGPGAGSGRVVRGIRENPVPAALVGLGVAWLMLERTRSRAGPGDHAERGRYGERSWLSPGAEYTPHRESHRAEQVRHWAASAKDRIASGAHGLRERAGDIGYRIRHGLGGAVRHGFSGAGDRLGDWGYMARTRARRARRSIADHYDDSPLLMGAAALALGLVGGLSAPATRAETRFVSRVNRDIRDRARRVREHVDSGGAFHQIGEQAVGGRFGEGARRAGESMSEEAARQAHYVREQVRRESEEFNPPA